MDLSVVGTIVINVISTVFGGLILAFILFWIKEELSPLPEISGHWYFEAHTEDTSLGDFEDMKLTYEAMIWCEGRSIHGTFEKIYEDSSVIKRPYIGEARTRGTIQGSIEKNYLVKDRLFLHLVEAGKKRESTSFHQLDFAPDDRLVGSFKSTVAEQSGTVKWRRNRFQTS